ncbi:hypothetical protein V6N13_051301 [Hibiscus sabdariffa]
MENKKHVAVAVAVAGSSSPLDHLLSPRDPSSPSSTSAILGSIFPPPPKVPGIGGSWSWDNYQGKSGSVLLLDVLAHFHPLFWWLNFAHADDGHGHGGTTTNKDKSSSIYHNETVEPSYLSSSIYYGGQENYSPFNKATIKKEDDPNGNNSSGDGASRGNWWQGSLYY